MIGAMAASVFARGGAAKNRAPRPGLVLPSYDELYPKARSAASVTLRSVADPTAALQVDLEGAPSNLLRMAEARADQYRDIVLLTSDVRQLNIAANLIANLASVGVHHYILVADQASTCHKVAGRLACVWSTLLEPTYSGRLRGAATDRVRALWLMRQMYVGRLARLRFNPMMLDADVVLFHNPFALMRTHLPGYQVYVLGDTSAGWMSANAGTLYLRGSECAADSPALTVWVEFERRVFALLNTSAPFPQQQPHKVRGSTLQPNAPKLQPSPPGCNPTCAGCNPTPPRCTLRVQAATLRPQGANPRVQAATLRPHAAPYVCRLQPYAPRLQPYASRLQPYVCRCVATWWVASALPTHCSTTRTCSIGTCWA